MKKQIFIVFAVIVVACISSNIVAQEVMEVTKQRTKSNNTNEKTIDQSASVCTGKIRCGDGSCTIDFDQEVVSPRDAASGLPTGKRQHKPFTITKELDKSSPTMIRESPTKMSAGKASYSDLSVMVNVNGRSTKLPVVNGQFTMPSDGKDNDCDLIVSWSWGESQSGTSSSGATGGGISRYQATFSLAVEGGAFTASKHTKTGHVTLLK